MNDPIHPRESIALAILVASFVMSGIGMVIGLWLHS